MIALSQLIRSHVIFNRFVKYPKVEAYIDTWKLTENRQKILVHMHYEKKTKHVIKLMYASYDESLYKFVSEKRWNVYTDKPIKNISELCYVWRKIVNDDKSREDIIGRIIEEKRKVITRRKLIAENIKVNKCFQLANRA